MNGTLPRHNSQSFAHTVALLAPEVGEALLPLAHRQRVVEQCRGLPPILDGLLEFGLARDVTTVTLQQRLGHGSAEIELLRRHLAEGQESTISSEVALPLAKLLGTWQKPASPLNDTMTEVTLAYDFDDATEEIASSSNTPSLWVGFSQSLITPDERWISLQVALDILLDDQWRTWRDTLLRTMVASPPAAFVSHIGILWGSSEPRLRVNVKRLRTQTLARYLEFVAWPGDVVAAVTRADALLRYADHITLCLDISTEIAPSLGFECYLVSQSPTEARWAALLDDLVAKGLCSAEKRDAFLGWAGMTTPLLTDREWPDRLIVESLAHPANHLSVLQRRFGQIKVECGATGELRASASLRFVPQWLKF